MHLQEEATNALSGWVQATTNGESRVRFDPDPSHQPSQTVRIRAGVGLG